MNRAAWVTVFLIYRMHKNGHHVTGTSISSPLCPNELRGQIWRNPLKMSLRYCPQTHATQVRSWWPWHSKSHHQILSSSSSGPRGHLCPIWRNAPTVFPINSNISKTHLFMTYCTLTTSASVELQVTESSTSLTCPSVSTVTSLMGTATRRPVRIAVLTTSVSCRENEKGKWFIKKKWLHSRPFIFIHKPHLRSFLLTVCVNYLKGGLRC